MLLYKPCVRSTDQFPSVPTVTLSYKVVNCVGSCSSFTDTLIVAPGVPVPVNVLSVDKTPSSLRTDFLDCVLVTTGPGAERRTAVFSIVSVEPSLYVTTILFPELVIDWIYCDAFFTNEPCLVSSLSFNLASSAVL